VDVSWELANRSAPAALDVNFSDLVAVYGRKSDTDAMGGILANVTQTVAWGGTDQTLAKAIADAAVMVPRTGRSTYSPTRHGWA
jgi:hypothetical protein